MGFSLQFVHVVECIYITLKIEHSLGILANEDFRRICGPKKKGRTRG
jgi:hypothetical protein